MTRMSLSIVLVMAFGVMGIGCASDDDGADEPSGNNEGNTPGGGQTGSDEKGIESGGDADSDTDTDTDSDADSDGDGDSDQVVDTAFVEVDWETDGYRDSATNTDLIDAGQPDGSYPDASWDAGPCADWELNVKVNPSRLMILQDISSSMREGTPTKWVQASSALISLLGDFGFTDLLEFGLDVFPDQRDCFATDPLVVDSAPSNGQNIFDILTLLELSQSTPLFMAMGNFLDSGYAPVFTSKDVPSYLIIVSDGKDTCGNETGHFPDESKGANAAQLGTRAKTLLMEQQIFTIAIGFGDAADPEQLNAIAENGGTDYDRYIQANNRAELEEVFHELAAYTINCEFDVNPNVQAESGWKIDYSNIEFYMDGSEVPHDVGCAAGVGWDWVALTEEDKRVVFCQEACMAIRDKGSSSISAAFECIPDYIII